MPGVTISFNFDDLPADGEVCTICQEPITGTVYHPYIQVGKPEDGKHLDRPMCEKCYAEFMNPGE